MAAATSEPTVAGTADFAVAAVRVRAVATPTAPNTPMPTTPIQRRRTARMPMTMAKTASSTTVPRMSMGLSFVPNWRMANSLTGAGTWSITHSPTEITGEVVPRIRPATSWATPSATPAATRPASAPCHRGGDPARAGAGRRRPLLNEAPTTGLRGPATLRITAPRDRPRSGPSGRVAGPTQRS